MGKYTVYFQGKKITPIQYEPVCLPPRKKRKRMCKPWRNLILPSGIDKIVQRNFERHNFSDEFESRYD